MPVGLRQDAHLEALGFQQSPDDGHAETRMVDIRIAGDDDDVAPLPAERRHLGSRRREEGSGWRRGGCRAARAIQG